MIEKRALSRSYYCEVIMCDDYYFVSFSVISYISVSSVISVISAISIFSGG